MITYTTHKPTHKTNNPEVFASLTRKMGQAKKILLKILYVVFWAIKTTIWSKSTKKNQK